MRRRSCRPGNPPRSPVVRTSVACSVRHHREWHGHRRSHPFDRLSHDHILESLGSFPARGLVRRWLKAGVIEDGRFTLTGEGAPQGGVISPALMNVALHGMEQADGVRYWETGGGLRVTPDSPVLVRYVDDVLALCHSREQAENIQQRLASWLEPRGLVFNQAKTRITHLDQGVDFLGLRSAGSEGSC
ncbi:reverse transcriptase domain-containing protein [Nonomuraea sp. JJY05]|uniref:reverse transcriptase domain-containing protein n=1 Tax=Nonomuraea sp. JJY05 TaxID=3350255 RepID=UPI00373EA66E